MADDFDDDLFNAYNEASDVKPIDNSHDTFEDEFADALDTTKDDQQDRFMDDGNQSPPPPPPRQQQQQQQQHQQNYSQYTNQQRYYQQQQQNVNQQNQPQTVMMGGVPMPYQMALAYQQQMQQMMANPIQFQMMQQQYRQMQQQQQQQQQQQRRPYQQRSHAPEDKEALERKMFIGGLDWDTTDDSLKDHFSKFGPVASCSVMRDMATGQSRGFAFLSMVNASDVDKVLEQPEHIVDGKKVDPKRAVSRSEQPPPNNQQQDDAGGNTQQQQQSQHQQQQQSEKIFVGGIAPTVERDEFKGFFEQFGAVADATLMMDRQTGRPRGFGFITFEDADAVERALDANPDDLVIKEKRVEIKRATPKTRSSQQQQQPFNRGPNTRYAGAAQGFRPMYGNQGQPYAAMAAAAAYYGRMNQQQQHHHQQPHQQDDHGSNDDYDRRSSSSHRDHHRDHHHHHRSSRHRDSSRDDRYRDDRSGGGAVHASSSSRNQSSYRPY